MSNMLFRIRHRMSITEYRYRIRYRMSNIRCRIFDTPISYIKKYTTSYTITCIRHTISYTTSYKMYDIVCFFAGSCHFCIRRRIRYRIRRRMSNIRYRMSKIQYRISNIRYRIRHRIKCAISYVFVAGSCHFYIRRRIRYRIKKYDVVYDMQLLVAIIRYRTYISYASSLLYDIARQNRKKHTM
jgi:hypothetical protein